MLRAIAQIHERPIAVLFQSPTQIHNPPSGEQTAVSRGKKLPSLTKRIPSIDDESAAHPVHYVTYTFDCDPYGTSHITQDDSIPGHPKNACSLGE